LFLDPDVRSQRGSGGGGNDQMFGAIQQVPHGGSCDGEASLFYNQEKLLTAQLSQLENALEHILEDPTAKAEAHLTTLLKSPGLQKVAEKGIASLDQTEKDALTALLASSSCDHQNLVPASS
jgi:hypothetical protein